jgi:hypothetical protein
MLEILKARQEKMDANHNEKMMAKLDVHYEKLKTSMNAWRKKTLT